VIFVFSTAIYIRIGTFRFFKLQKVKFCIAVLYYPYVIH